MKSMFALRDRVLWRGRPGTIVAEWGVLWACKECFKPLSSPTQVCCGKQPTTISCDGIYDIEMDDNQKTYAVNKRWLIGAAGVTS